MSRGGDCRYRHALARRASSRRRLLANRSFLIGAALVGTVVVLACLAGVIAPFDPLKGNFRVRLAPPGIDTGSAPTISAATSCRA